MLELLLALGCLGTLISAFGFADVVGRDSLENDSF
jgi:hypothetical protein